jgi:hypothetical protein
MRPRHLLPLALAGALVLPSRGEEPENRSPVLQKLASRQQRAAQQLKDLLGQVQVLAEDLRRRNEKDKALMLERAVAIVLQQKIPVSSVAAGDEKGELVLGDLQHAMNQMARILEQRPDATAEVQNLGVKVVETLQQVLHVLTGPDDIKSLGEREEALRDARAEVAGLAKRERELRQQTQTAAGRTAAEEAARRSAEELARLGEQLQELDRRARAELKEIDAARERATRLSDLLSRQQQLQQETQVRSGSEADTITPQVNRALAELEAIARAARAAEEAAAAKGTLGDSAREIEALARRQQAVAREIAMREALERARDAADGAKAKEETEKAAALSEGAEKDALRRIAAGFESDEAGREKARAAVEAILAKGPSKEALAEDEAGVAKDAENALASAPPVAEDALHEAATEAARAAEGLKTGRAAEGSAKKAAEALRRAQEAVAKAAKEEKGGSGGEEKQAAEAAARARALAAEAKALAESEKAKEGGMAAAAEATRDAAERAAAELDAAAEAARAGDAQRAEEQARDAAERTEQAMRELGAKVRVGADLAERQGLVADDLRNLADQPAEKDAPGLREAAEHASGARDEIRKADLAAAKKQQEQVIEKLGELVKKAEAQAQEAAEKNKAALEQTQQATEAAAKRAEEIGKGLGEGARSARESDARRRMESAAARTQEAAEALRRSLRRLQQGLSKSAEQDRLEAKESVEAARKNLEGLRESHTDLSQGAREEMKKIAERQGELEEQVKQLEQRLRKHEEKSGAERLQDAQAAMREARQALEAGEPDEAERAQERAEKALDEAQQELEGEERRYRQLRQHELLYKLKEELKNFRRAAQGHREHLQLIEAEVRKAGRVTRPIRRGPLKELTDQVTALQRDVASKTGAVEEEGAVVYTYILKGCAADLAEVAAQLGLSEVGILPQELLGDVVRRFDLAIKGLERDLQERRDEQGQQQQQQQGGPSPVQNKPVLVPADAEIRMMLVLQKALNEERENFFANRPGFGKEVPTDADKARIERMYHQQGSLAELFDSLSRSIFGQGEGHGPGPDEMGPEGGGDPPEGGGEGAGGGEDGSNETDDGKEGGR